MEKNGGKAHLSSLAMLQSILQRHNGTFFSVKELAEKIGEAFETTISRETLVRAVDQLKHCNPFFQEKTERRGKLNLPVKVFAIHLPINTESCSES